MEIHLRGPSRGTPFGPWWVALIPGAACILMGILIVAVPSLLETLVASAFILVGLVLFSAALRLRPR